MALIACKECGRIMSDKAIACLDCGYPINPLPAQNKAVTRQRRAQNKYHRLPNGFGQIKYLGKGRRKPYGAYLPVKEYADNGSAKSTKALGYFETYQDAYACLAEYQKNPYDTNITFADVYKGFYNEKFNDPLKQYSQSSRNGASSAFKNASALHDMKMRDIRTEDMQKVVDECKLKHASLEKLVDLFKNMSKYAVKHDIIQKDYATFVKIKVADDDEKGVPFSEDALKIIWENRNSFVIKILLIMIFSGMRISELKVVKVDLERHMFVGGLKTDAGKNRIIPIHKAIEPYVGELKNLKGAHTYRDDLYNKLTELGIDTSVKNTKHTPHDARHTFSWLADAYKMDEVAKHLIMGHSLGKDVEVKVYGHRTDKELTEEMNKIKIDKFLRK